MEDVQRREKSRSGLQVVERPQYGKDSVLMISGCETFDASMAAVPAMQRSHYLL